MKILPLIFAAITIVMPVVTQRTGLSKKYGFPLKMLCAFLYIVTGVLSSVTFGKSTEYSFMILCGLALGVLGDFFLEFKAKKLFPLGVVFFALGHIAYSVTFLFTGTYKSVSHLVAVTGITAALTAAVILFAKTKLILKGKKKMLLVYAPVLIFSFTCAVVKGVAALNEGNLFFGLCLTAGGTLFFASDVMIGVDKGGIKRPPILHNAVSYTYFAAQALFALSILYQ